MNAGDDGQSQRMFGEYSKGSRIEGRWEVLDVRGGKGQSGMGVVYIVRDSSDGKLLACKTFQPQFLSDAKIRLRLRREAELWMELGEHPNIVKVEFVQAIGSRLFIFMELVSSDEKGRNSLRHFLKGESLPMDLVLRWARGACRGMAHAEGKGLKCHRDLKPDNLMVTPEHRLKITDFGLARSEVPDREKPGAQRDGLSPGRQVHITLRGVLLGSPGYIAPEIIAGEQADIRGDIYAFGLILHQTLSGNPLPPLIGLWQGDPVTFERENLDIRAKEPPPPIHPAFDALIAKCLSFSPKDRFQTFSEMVKPLDNIAADFKADRGSTPLAVPTTKWERLPNEESRRNLLDRAISLYSLARFDEALTCVQKLRERFGADYSIWNTEGVIFTDLGKYAEALACLKKSISLNDSWVNSWCNIGRCYRAMKQPAEGVVCYEKAITIDSTHTPPWVSKGNCLLDLERNEEALFCFERALRIDSNTWNAWSGKGEVLMRLCRFNEAVTCLQNALKLEPNRESVLSLLEKARSRAQEQARAANPDRSVSKPEALSKSSLIAKAHACYAQGKMRQGLDLLQEVKRRFGADENLLTDEAAFLCDLGQHLEAISCVEQALAINPRIAAAWNNKGRALRFLGRHEEALPCYDHAISCSPNHVTPWMNKGHCLAALGRKNEARACYEKVLLIDPNNSQAKQALADT